MKKQIATLKRRGLSVFLALALCVSLVQVNAFALEPEENPVPVEPTALTIDLENPDGKQDPAPSEDDPAADPDQSDPAEEPDPAPDPAPAAEEEPGQGEGEEPGDPEPGQGEGTDNPAEETPQEPEEGSVKTDEVLEAGKDQLLKPPEGYEKQEDGSYAKKESTTSETDSGIIGNKTHKKVETVTTHTYSVNEVTDKETGAFLGYEAVTTIDTKHITTTSTISTTSSSTVPQKTVTEDELPIVKKVDESGKTEWVVRDPDSGAAITAVKKGILPHTKNLPCEITYEVTIINEDENETTKTNSEKTVKQVYKIFYDPQGNVTRYSLYSDYAKTVTETHTVMETSEPTRTSTKQLLTVEQDADGVITYKAPVSTGSELVDMKPVEADVKPDGLRDFKKGLIETVDQKAPAEVSSDFLFQWTGEFGPQSIVALNPKDVTDRTPDGVQEAKFFLLKDGSGNEYSVYCADMTIPATSGTDYTLGNLEDGLDSFFPTTLDTNIVEKARNVALNGYWGTKEGFGSLENVKNLMRHAIEAGEIKGVTVEEVDQYLHDGAAMAATQAAIWHFTNDGMNENDPFYSNGIFVRQTDKVFLDWNNRRLFSGAREKVTKALYEYLINHAEAPEEFKEATDIIRADDLKEVKIDVIDVSKEAAVDSAAVYNADVSFILDVDVDRMNSDNLVVTLIDAQTGNKIGESYKLLDARQEGGDGKTYTLANVQLPNGTTITLKLNGTQAVEKNAYLILADTGHEMSQTFVGVMEGDYNVDLSMNVHFSINDITVKPDPTPTPTPRPDPTPDPDPDPDPDIPDPDVPLVPGPDPEEPPVDIPDPDVPLTPEPPEVDVPDPAVPLAPRPTKPAKPQTSVPTVTEIPDQAVPLADVPNTGDESALWLSVALAAAAGIVSVKLLEKKKVK